MTFIKDLPRINTINPKYVDALDSFLFKWTESMLPYYEELKRREADVFLCENVSTFGKDWAECYDRNGIHYRFDKTPLWRSSLSLDGGAGYTEMNWRTCFWNEYPEFHGSKLENIHEVDFFEWYFHRYHKKNPKYNVVTDRLKEYFRQLTGDSAIVFDVGWKSFIYSDPRIKSIIDYSPALFY